MEKAKFTLRIEEKKLKEMKINAINENLHLNDLIEKLFDEYLKKTQKKQDEQVA